MEERKIRLSYRLTTKQTHKKACQISASSLWNSQQQPLIDFTRPLNVRQLCFCPAGTGFTRLSSAVHDLLLNKAADVQKPPSSQALYALYVHLSAIRNTFLFDFLRVLFIPFLIIPFFPLHPLCHLI
jgi:hypothetical protein